MLQDIHSEPDRALREWQNACDAAEAMDVQTGLWHQDAGSAEGGLLLRLHRANFDLWHLEDEARDPLATDAKIAAVKHSIDAVNQQRNDTAERLDEVLLAGLAQRCLPRKDAPLHSETPGQMFDRLSILSLKIFHTGEEISRENASETYRGRNRERLALLREQREDLCGCLSELCTQVMRGTRRFKQYRQLKMYNDAELNPVIRRAHRGGARVEKQGRSG